MATCALALMLTATMPTTGMMAVHQQTLALTPMRVHSHSPRLRSLLSGISWQPGIAISMAFLDEILPSFSPFLRPAGVVKYLNDYHSYSQLILHPWGYTSSPIDDYADVQRVANEVSITSYIKYVDIVENYIKRCVPSTTLRISIFFYTYLSFSDHEFWLIALALSTG